MNGTDLHALCEALTTPDAIELVMRIHHMKLLEWWGKKLYPGEARLRAVQN